jgi:hypothetical protein
MVTLDVVGTSNQGMKSLTAIILDATVYFGGIKEKKTMGEVWRRGFGRSLQPLTVTRDASVLINIYEYAYKKNQYH